MEGPAKVDWEASEESAKSQDEDEKEEKPPLITPQVVTKAPVPKTPRKPRAVSETPAPPATSLIASAVSRAASVAANAQNSAERFDRLAAAIQTPLRPLPTSWATTARSPEWAPILIEMWVRFPGHDGPVWGWFRESAGTSPDAFFASDGEVRFISRTELDEYQYQTPSIAPVETHPYAVRLHPLLFPSVRRVLRKHYVMGTGAEGPTKPVATEKDWRKLISPGSSSAMPYTMVCDTCGKTRHIKRMDSRVVENLPIHFRFFCSQVGLRCHSTDIGQVSFGHAQLSQSLQTEAGTPLLPNLSLGDSQGEQLPQEKPKNSSWTKRLKDWPGIPKYEGTPSLVLLRGWRVAMEEAFRNIKVPEGRDQVLAATNYFAGEAARWWASILGQPLGTSLSCFLDLYDALEEHFIPQDAEQKALASWNALRQRGTIDEYMKRVDELAVAHPMGEVGEYWHAWNGLRSELKAEVKFALRELGKETCSRQELRRLLKGLEVKYPSIKPNPRPFFPRSQPRSTETRAVSTTTPIICWICDKQGHRATECSRRKSSGCPRCGSKAHGLVACPQRLGRKKEGGKPPSPVPTSRPRPMKK